MFGHDAEPTRNYRYGALQPTGGLDAIRDQMRLSHRYRNALVEAELERRKRSEEAVLRHFPELGRVEARLAEIEAGIDAARKEAKQANSLARKRLTMIPGQKASIQALKVERAGLRAARKQLRAGAYGPSEAMSVILAEIEANGESPDASRRLEAARAEWHARIPASATLRVDLDAVEEWHAQKRKALREASGLYWPNKAIVEQAMQGARSGAPPRFMRWTGGGTVAVQVQTKRDGDGNKVQMTPADLFGCQNSLLRIVPPEAAIAAWAAGMRPSRPMTRTTALFRVGSDAAGKPHWAKVPIILHRPIPDDATIKWAYLSVYKVADKEKWSLRLSLARAAGWRHADCAAEGRVGIDVGWRLLDHGLRVAYWVGDDGREGELVLPTAWLMGWKKVEDLISIRKKNFNAAKEAVAGWLRGRGVPAWLSEKTETMANWKSQERLAALAIRWRGERFAGDEGAYEALEAWRRQDKHLWTWERNQARNLLASREDMYRVFACRMRRAYAEVVLEDFRLSDLQAMPPPEDEVVAAAREHQRDACASLLRRCLAESMGATTRVPARHTTMRCASCGRVADFDRSDLLAKCPGCGELEDQDRRAARNLLGEEVAVAH